MPFVNFTDRECAVIRVILEAGAGKAAQTLYNAKFLPPEEVQKATALGNELMDILEKLKKVQGK